MRRKSFKRSYRSGLSWLHLVRRPTAQAVGLKVVEAKDLDRPLDAEMVQDASHFQGKQVILRDTREIFNKKWKTTRGFQLSV